MVGAASTCSISIRSAPGTLFPRWIQRNTPDIRDDRLTYNLPHILAPFILWGHRKFYYEQKERPELFRWAADSNYRNKRCPFTTNACKSFGIPEAIIDHKAELCGEEYDSVDSMACGNSPEAILKTLQDLGKQLGLDPEGWDVGATLTYLEEVRASQQAYRVSSRK